MTCVGILPTPEWASSRRCRLRMVTNGSCGCPAIPSGTSCKFRRSDATRVIRRPSVRDCPKSRAVQTQAGVLQHHQLPQPRAHRGAARAVDDGCRIWVPDADRRPSSGAGRHSENELRHSRRAPAEWRRRDPRFSRCSRRSHRECPPRRSRDGVLALSRPLILNCEITPPAIGSSVLSVGLQKPTSAPTQAPGSKGARSGAGEDLSGVK